MEKKERKPILEVRHLNSWYTAGGAFARKKRVPVLKDISFTAKKGEEVHFAENITFDNVTINGKRL